MIVQARPDEARIERLIAMADRLIEALEGDIAALKSGNPRAMRTLEPEIQKLSVLYSREAATFGAQAAKDAPGELRKRLIDATGRFRDALGAQTRLLARMRGASEGMIRAVAEEIERRNAQARPYRPRVGERPRGNGAVIYNSVV